MSDLGDHKRSGVAVPVPKPAPAPLPDPAAPLPQRGQESAHASKVALVGTRVRGTHEASPPSLPDGWDVQVNDPVEGLHLDAVNERGIADLDEEE